MDKGHLSEISKQLADRLDGLRSPDPVRRSPPDLPDEEAIALVLLALALVLAIHLLWQSGGLPALALVALAGTAFAFSTAWVLIAVPVPGDEWKDYALYLTMVCVSVGGAISLLVIPFYFATGGAIWRHVIGGVIAAVLGGSLFAAAVYLCKALLFGWDRASWYLWPAHRGDRRDVFISYASDDIASVKDFVDTLKERFKHQNVAFYDGWDMDRRVRSDEEIRRELRDGIRKCGILLAIASPRYLGSCWCRFELDEVSPERVLPLEVVECGEHNLIHAGLSRTVRVYACLAELEMRTSEGRQLTTDDIKELGKVLGWQAKPIVKNWCEHCKGHGSFSRKCRLGNWPRFVTSCRACHGRGVVIRHDPLPRRDLEDIARMLYDGWQVPRDHVLARALADVSGSTGLRRTIAARLTRDQRKEARRLALEGGWKDRLLSSSDLDLAMPRFGLFHGPRGEKRRA